MYLTLVSLVPSRDHLCIFSEAASYTSYPSLALDPMAVRRTSVPLYVGRKRRERNGELLYFHNSSHV
jgi:hypothetical protein